MVFDPRPYTGGVPRRPTHDDPSRLGEITQRPAMTSDSSDRLVVRLPNWAGDIMMALPALKSLRQAFPRAHLIGMARPGHVELAQRITVLDQVLVAPAQTGWNRHLAIWNSTRQLRGARCGVALLLATSFEAALTVWLAGVPLRAGHGTDHRALLLNRVVEGRGGHRADHFQEVVSVLGGVPSDGADVFRCAPSDRQYAERFLFNAGIDPGMRPVFINPASAKGPRSWSSGRFRQLADGIAAQHAGVPVLVHHRHPFDLPPAWPSSSSIHIISDASLVELAGVIERCVLYVGNDSGPMHVAAALGLPTIGIYGPSSPARTSPRGRKDLVHVDISAEFECAPCRERFFEECPSPPSWDERPPCLNAIEVDTVAEAVDRLLREGGSS